MCKKTDEQKNEMYVYIFPEKEEHLNPKAGKMSACYFQLLSDSINLISTFYHDFYYITVVIFANKFHSGGTCGVMFITIGNGHSDQSSNPREDSLHLTLANALQKGMRPTILPPAISK